MNDRIENGLDVLRREARCAEGRERNWKRHNEIVRRAQQHVEACGGNWLEYAPRFSLEIANLMRL